ncbi:MAG: YebB family permuted papain-like enzyme [Verrucomicrobiota bacterium]
MPIHYPQHSANASQLHREIPAPIYSSAYQPLTTQLSIEDLESELRVGDVIFIQSIPLPFRQVSLVTGCWCNHVGIIESVEDGKAVVAESTFPFSRRTQFSSFVKRSCGGRVAVSRLRAPFGVIEQLALRRAIQQRMGVVYDTGFNLNSRRQFCSRFVREVLDEATGIKIGEIDTFAQLLDRQSGINLGFWRAWYFGRIPWQRLTVTPASVLQSPHLHLIFDGVIGMQTGGVAASKNVPEPRLHTPQSESTRLAILGGKAQL